MTKSILATLFLLSGTVQAAIQIGDPVSNYCWQTVENKTLCLDDYKDHVRVLLFNAGWCSPCNSHMTELGKTVTEFSGRPVKFISLSLAGWKKATPADTQFLKEWQAKHHIPFDVAAALKTDFKDMMVENGIPADAVVDQSGKLRFRGAGVPISELFKQIKALLPQ